MWVRPSLLAFNKTSTSSPEDIRRRKRQKHNASVTTAEKLQRLSAKRYIPVFSKRGNHPGSPRGRHTKTQTGTLHCMCCEMEWEKTNHPSLNTYSDRDSAFNTGWKDSFVLTSPGMVGICLIFRVWVEAETDPERVGGLVLWSLWRSLRLRRRGEFTGLDQGLRLRPDKVILCLHLWALPPLDDLRGRRGRGERAARYASKLQALFQ